MVVCEKEWYFRDPSTGNWLLHVPDKTVDKDSHRWPIGFVTTPTVQGRYVNFYILFNVFCVDL